MSYSEIGLELVKAVITALLAAVLVRLFEYRHFIRGLWWERKDEAYGSIIDALVSIRESCVALSIAVEWQEELGYGFGKNFFDAGGRLLRAWLMGDYIISRRAAAVLKELYGKLLVSAEVPGGGSEAARFIEDLSAEVGECLKVVCDEAKKDLQVKWYKWW